MNVNAEEKYLHFNERMLFLKKFLKSPSQVGSITPSSLFLARKMLEGIDWKNVRAIAELGAGTGVFTRSIDKLKHPECKVAVFEKDLAMRSELAARYPRLSFFEDALFLTQTINKMGLDSLDTIVSGLPFALMSEVVREKIINEVLTSLKPGGTFVTFQLSLQMRSLLRKKFSSVEICFVPLNIPPAFVYVCHKQGECMQ